MIAWTGAIGMPIFVLWAWWADRHRVAGPERAAGA
jgi:hypothetical protein